MRLHHMKNCHHKGFRAFGLSALLLLGAHAMALEVDSHGEEDPGAERARQLDSAQPGMVPFVLPWNDGAPGPTDMRFLNAGPAGAHGRVVAKEDGHLYTEEGRIRFFAVNLCFKGAVPSKEDAPHIAARMAKFGINLVRFHHIDNARSGLLPSQEDSRIMDAEVLDRIHFLIAELKKQGIYTNLNLLVSRRFRAGDGVGPIHTVKGKMHHLIGMWHDGAFQLQTDYAKALLTAENPYTGLSLAADPAVAFVEVLNENGLANTWFSPARSAFAGDLRAQPEEIDAAGKAYVNWLQQLAEGAD